MYYTPLVQPTQEIGTAAAEPETAVHPTAGAPRPQRRVDNFRTQDSEEMLEEAERLNDRCRDLEQYALGDPHNMAVVRQTNSQEREAFQEKMNLCSKITETAEQTFIVVCHSENRHSFAASRLYFSEEILLV